jgi:hypothetical protein
MALQKIGGMMTLEEIKSYWTGQGLEFRTELSYYDTLLGCAIFRNGEGLHAVTLEMVKYGKPSPEEFNECHKELVRWMNEHLKKKVA